MHFQMTDYELEHGEACHSGLCPVALCLQRTTGERWDVGDVTCAREAEPDINYPLPDVVVAFVAAFDAGEDVGPIEFDLPIAEKKP